MNTKDKPTVNINEVLDAKRFLIGVNNKDEDHDLEEITFILDGKEVKVDFSGDGWVMAELLGLAGFLWSKFGEGTASVSGVLVDKNGAREVSGEESKAILQGKPEHYKWEAVPETSANKEDVCAGCACYTQKGCPSDLTMMYEAMDSTGLDCVEDNIIYKRWKNK